MSFPILAERQLFRLDKGMEMISDCQAIAEKTEELIKIHFITLG